MKSYKSLLKKSENLEELFKKIDDRDLFYELIKDLIENEIEELLNHNYIQSDYTFSHEEFVFQYLTSINISLKRPFIDSLNRLYLFYIDNQLNEQNELYLCKILTISNLNYGLIYQNNLYKSLVRNVSIDTSLKIWQSILQYEKKQSNTENSLIILRESIMSDINSKPWLLSILIESYLPNKPLEALTILSDLDYNKIVIDSDYMFELVLSIRELIIVFFDNNNTKDSNLVSKFSSLILNINSSIIINIIYDILHLEEFKSILIHIAKISADTIIDLHRKCNNIDFVLINSNIIEEVEKWKN